MHAEHMIDRAQIQAELKKLKRPEFVQDLRVSTGQDASGDEALWIWLIVDPDSVSEAGAMNALQDLRNQLRARVSELAPDVWPYIRLDNPH